MKRYLLVEGDHVAPNLARTIEQLAVGKLLVSNIHERQAKALLEQLPSRDRQVTGCLLTVNRGQVRATTGKRAAWQLVRLLGPVQGWRVWNLAQLHKRALNRNFQ